jgi:hypothetical protein
MLSRPVLVFAACSTIGCDLCNQMWMCRVCTQARKHRSGGDATRSRAVTSLSELNLTLRQRTERKDVDARFAGDYYGATDSILGSPEVQTIEAAVGALGTT